MRQEVSNKTWIRKKVKEYVTIEKNNNKGYCHIQKGERKRLSHNALQAKLAYNHIIKFGYKLQNLRLDLRIKVDLHANKNSTIKAA